MAPEIQHPGILLQECYLRPLDITPAQLAESIGLPLGRVSELIEGRRPITPDLAARLALFFDVPPEWWLVHQARYEAREAAPMEELRHEVSPYPGLSDVLITPRGVTRLAPAEETSSAKMTATFSPDFLARLRAQTELVNKGQRTISEITLDDGTLALVGK